MTQYGYFSKKDIYIYIYISVLSYKKFIYFNYLIHCTGWQLVINMYKVTNYLKIVTNNKLLDDRSL